MRFTNATRDADGQPMAATLDPGDGSPSVSMAAGATYVHTYSNASASTLVRLVAADVTLARTVTVAEAPPVPGLGQPGDPEAWGYDREGQLGDGVDRPSRFEAAPVANLANVAAMDGGINFAVALLSDGSVWSFGEGGNGELGDGKFGQRGWPVPASLPARVRQISAGEHFVLALDADGVVWSWGANFKGQLGTGTTQGRAAPAPLPGLPPIVFVASGGDHSLAVANDGSVWAWGRNDAGQLGTGHTSDYEATPARVLGQDGVAFLQGIRAVAAGGAFSMALGADGSVWTWGEDQYGQLGRNTRNLDSATPIKVLASTGTGTLTGISGVAAGDEFALALASDGSVWGWGRTDMGQTGSLAATICGASSIPCSPRPSRAPFADGVKALAAGARHALALTADNRLWSWGSNGEGELGVSTDVSFRVAPEAVSGRTALAIGAGDGFSLAVRPNETPLVAPANDAFAAATAVDSLPTTFSGNTLLATLESGEPTSGACGDAGRSIWYRINPTVSGKLIASTVGSFFDTRLTLFSGPGLANLTPVACDGEVGTLNAQVEAGQTYYIQLAGTSTYSGTAHAGQFQLSLTLGNAPANDNLEAAQAITIPGSLNVDTAFATVQDGEYDGCLMHTGKSVWYQFTATSAGSYVFDATAVGFRPSMELYTSRATPATIYSLQGMACSSEVAPRMVDSLQAGKTYYLRVAGEGGAGGPVTLSINPASPPANDLFANAADLSVPGTGTGELLLATDQAGEPSACFTSGAPSVWYRVQPAQTGRMTLRVSSQATVAATLYRANGDGLANLEPLQNGCAHDPDPVTGAWIGELQAGVGVGQTLYLQVIDPDRAGLPFTIDASIET